MCALVAPMLLSCNGSDGMGVDDRDVVATVTVTPLSATIDIGQAIQLVATARNSEGDILAAEVSWSSDPPGVASVGASTGQVTGLLEGPVTITATAEGRSGAATVVVTDPFPPGVPSDVQASTVSDRRVDITWADNSETEDSFLIERQTLSAGAPPAQNAEPASTFAGVGSVGANVTTFEDTGVDPATTYRYQVKACNENGCSEASDDAALVETFGTLGITTTALPDGLVETAYQETLAAAGGNGELIWSVSEGELPPGLTVFPTTGVISGIPTTAGVYDFTVQADGAGQTVTRDLSITIEMYAVLGITTVGLPGGQVGSAYAETVVATGGDGDYTWSIAGGDLPPGLAIGPGSGEISGDPEGSGTFDVTVEVNSGDGQTAQAPLTIVIAPAPTPVSIATTSLPDGEEGTPYAQALVAAGGTGTFAWLVTNGALPQGLNLDPNAGVVFGVPTEAGTSAFTVRVASGGEVDFQDLSITIAPAPLRLDTDLIVGAFPGAAYSDFFEASGGDGTYVFSHVAGTLPDGLLLNGMTGELSGTAGTPGAYFFTIRVSSGGQDVSRTFALAISTKPASAFNIAIANGAGNTIPSAAVIAGLSTALARWESVIVGDLGDYTYGPNGIPPGYCSGDGLNGQTVDDIFVMVRLDNIDGPGSILGSAGPCDARVFAFPAINFATIFGRLTLDTSDLDTLDAHQLTSVIFHEIGHIVGIGTIWPLFSQLGAADLISGAIANGGTEPKYEGVNGNAVYTGPLDGGSSGIATKIPIEDGGGEGTQDSHWEESEFDNEIMTGYAESSGIMMPVSEMTIAAVGDFRYTVDTGAADPFVIPGCAPTCTTAPPPPPGFGAPGLGDRLLNDIHDEPLRAILPDGTTIVIPRPSER